MKVDDLVEVEGCKYPIKSILKNTIVVDTNYGKRVVQKKNMKFVGPVIENIDRVMPLTTIKL
ncbi:hypothetical protein P7H75_02885 [Vagococcus carniphilus]|uniref:hypothetical protein n=1 Tax=Vagococcus carniphilus TaxID=218144 RepID=UPI00288F9BAC|nr:hypothetical protein [Vagococcus carniphilus]MDT2813777.1 hypothetical protein [Vagococcus carniphilus]